MRPCDLDRSGDVWTYRPEHHKTEHHGKQRTIFLGSKAQAVLLPYLLRGETAYLFSPAEPVAKQRAVRSAARRTPMSCGNRPGRNRKKRPVRTPGDWYNRDAYRVAIQRACAKAGVARWSPNRLRHSAATEIRHQFGLEAAQVALGPSTADITQVYAERDGELARKVAARLCLRTPLQGKLSSRSPTFAARIRCNQSF